MIGFETQLPSLPKLVISGFGTNLKQAIENQVASLIEEAVLHDEVRDSCFKQTRKIFFNTNQILFSVRIGNFNDVDSLLSVNEVLIRKMVEESDNRGALRDYKLSQAVEKFSEARLLVRFFQTGSLVPLSQMAPCTDEEYVGAIFGFAQELARYAMGRASDGDVASVRWCRELVLLINGKLLEFNFRNGQLRRKYDSLKYSLKTLENIMCELSFIDRLFEGTKTSLQNEDDKALKKTKLGDDSNSTYETIKSSNDSTAFSVAYSETEAARLLEMCLQEIEEIRVRMEAQDAAREDVIKQSRDVQKLSKQSVYAAQRGTLEEAESKLKSAATIIVNILKVIDQYPMLRQGAVSSCVEEWVEGSLLAHFNRHKSLLTISDMLPVRVDAAEYVGGLSDLTGELGRAAVSRASARDYQGVHDILQVDLIISTAITQANVGGRYSRKADAVLQNLRKVEDLLYELSLQRLGGRAVSALREAPPMTSNGTGAVTGEDGAEGGGNGDGR